MDDWPTLETWVIYQEREGCKAPGDRICFYAHTLPKRYTEVLTLRTSEWELTWKQSHCRGSQLRWTHSRTRQAPHSQLLESLTWHHKTQTYREFTMDGKGRTGGLPPPAQSHSQPVSPQQLERNTTTQFQISRLPSCEVTHFCCFKSLRQYCLNIVDLGNDYIDEQSLNLRLNFLAGKQEQPHGSEGSFCLIVLQALWPMACPTGTQRQCPHTCSQISPWGIKLVCDQPSLESSITALINDIISCLN